jgi:hypothetical protein
MTSRPSCQIDSIFSYSTRNPRTTVLVLLAWQWHIEVHFPPSHQLEALHRDLRRPVCYACAQQSHEFEDSVRDHLRLVQLCYNSMPGFVCIFKLTRADHTIEKA